MIFVPLTFVTSVYGMTNMDTRPTFWKFGVTLATVCVPFFLLIGFLNTDNGYRFWAEKTAAIYRWFKPKPKSMELVDDAPPPPPNRTFSTEEGMRMRMRQGQGLGMGMGMGMGVGSEAEGLSRTSTHTHTRTHPHIAKMVQAMGEGKPSGLARMGTLHAERRATLDGDAVAERREEEEKEEEDKKESSSTPRDTVIDVKEE